MSKYFKDAYDADNGVSNITKTLAAFNMHRTTKPNTIFAEPFMKELGAQETTKSIG